MPHNGSNPLTSEKGKKILDRKVEAMLEKRAIRVADLAVPGAISSFSARPKKTKGKWHPIISMKLTNSFIVYQQFMYDQDPG